MSARSANLKQQFPGQIGLYLVSPLSPNKKWEWGTGEIARQLKALAALAEGKV